MSWWNSNWNSLEPETAQSIEQVSFTEKPLENGTLKEYRCGCERSTKDGDWFHMCSWHQGYDEAVCVLRGEED